MKLVVCGLADLTREAARHAPVGVVSLLAPGQNSLAVPRGAERLALRFHDVAEPRDSLTAPDTASVRDLLAFAERFPADAVLLVHCWMAISRSPAAAFILACARAPATPEADLAARLRRASPAATPNPLLIALADDLLGRGGRMRAAIAGIGRGREAARGGAFTLEV